MTVTDFAKQIRSLRGPIYMTTLVGGDYDPINVQVVKADLLWTLDRLPRPDAPSPWSIISQDDTATYIDSAL